VCSISLLKAVEDLGRPNFRVATLLVMLLLDSFHGSLKGFVSFLKLCDLKLHRLDGVVIKGFDHRHDEETKSGLLRSRIAVLP
jgi:hypothetical protein